MSKHKKLLYQILIGHSDANISFKELCKLLEKLGFECRIKGDHFIFYRRDILEIINIQSMKAKAKSYQVKQIRSILLRYKLGGEL